MQKIVILWGIVLLLVVGIRAQPFPVLSQDVEFVSNAPSGNLTLLGTLTLPQGPPGPYPAILLIAGSGPGQRNESFEYGALNFVLAPPKYPACGSTTVDVSVFVDIANFFSSMGFAVLRYDKRTCVVGSGIPGCQYPLCPLNEQNPPDNCLNLHAFTAWDLVEDAGAAVQFLSTFPKVNGANITVMGHSEGCTIAPYVANNNSDIVRQMVLLAGVGLPITSVVIDQVTKAVSDQETIIGACTAMGAPQSTIATLQNELVEIEASLQQTIEITDAILNGTYPPSQLVTWLVPNVPVGYVQSLYAMGQFEEIFSVVNRFVGNGGVMCAINSPTDFQVYPKMYSPLHAALQSITNNPQDVFLVNDLTHVLTPSDMSSGTVSQVLLDTIMNWGSNNATMF